MRVGRPAFLSAFSHRDYRLIWTGAFVSSVGTWMQDVALSWLIHTRIGDPLYLGLRSFTAEAPLLAFMLVGGAAADRTSRRGILLASNLFQMLLACLLAVLFITDRLGIGAILAVAFVTGLAQSQSAPTYQAVITSVVPPGQVANAVALNSLQFNLSRAIGPMLAGLLLARAGAGWCFAVNALSFVAVVLAVSRIRMPPPPKGTGESLGRSLRAGLAHVRGNPMLRSFTLLGGVASLLVFPVITYLPVVAGDTLGTGAAGYSLLLSSFGLGAIAGAIATAQRGGAPGRGRVMLLGFSAYGGAVMAAMIGRSQTRAMALLVVAGFAGVTAFSTLNSLVQEHAPDALKGRVLSIYGLAFRGGAPLGSLLAGVLVRHLGAPVTLAAFGALLVVLCGGVAVRGGRVARL
jgi:predicted MFS family arabinose efflux permease